MELFKCVRCSRIFDTVPSAKDHYTSAHSSWSNDDGENETRFTSVSFRPVRIVLTRIDSKQQTRNEKEGGGVAKAMEIKLDHLKASEIEAMIASVFTKGHHGGKSTRLRTIPGCAGGGGCQPPSQAVIGENVKTAEAAAENVVQTYKSKSRDCYSPTSSSEDSDNDSCYVPSEIDECDDDNEVEDANLTVKEENSLEDDTDKMDVVPSEGEYPSVPSKVATVRKEAVQIGVRHYHCHFCKKTFNRGSLLRHMRREHYSVNNNGFPCADCDKMFYTGMGFLAHGCQKVDIVNESPKIKREAHETDLEGTVSQPASQPVEMPQEIKPKTHKMKNEFKCELCGTRFGYQMQYYVRHMQENHRNQRGVYECPTCSQEFVTLQMFGRHLRKTLHATAKSNEPPNKRALKKNERLCTEVIPESTNKNCPLPKDSTCNLCGAVLSHFESLQSHLKTVHNVKRSSRFVFTCSLCDSKFINKERHMEHLKLHLPGNPYACKEDGCKKVFRNRSHLNDHMVIHTGVRKELFKCSYCSAELSRVGVMRKHIDYLHPGMTLKYTIVKPKEKKVKEKKKKTESTSHVEDGDCLRVEIGSIDLDDGAYQSTSVCLQSVKEEEQAIDKTGIENGIAVDVDLTNSDAVFDEVTKQYPGMLESIKRIKARRQRELLKCKECDWTGAYHTALVRHMEREHNLNKAVTTDKDSIHILCGSCGFMATSTEILNEHIKKQHSGDKRFPCHVCGVRFLTENKKIQHFERVHQGDKEKHQCQFPSCGKSYAKMTSLQRHTDLFHSLNGCKIECNLCGKHYNSDVALQSHQRNVHRNWGKYQCKCCGGTFATPHTLKGHVKRIHGGGKTVNVTEPEDKDASSILGLP